MAQVIGEIFDHEALSNREKRELWAYLTARPFGVDLGYSRPTAAKYEGMARRLGITVGSGDLDTVLTAHLDYDQGVEVVQAA